MEDDESKEVEAIDSDRILSQLYYNPKTGFMNQKQFIDAAYEYGISRNVVIKWYKKQAVNQIIVKKKKEPTAYHKIISDGDGYQADIIFFKYPKRMMVSSVCSHL